MLKKRSGKGEKRVEVTVPASEEAFDLSPLCWSRVRRLPEARRTSQTLTLLSALRGKLGKIIVFYPLLVNKCKHSNIICSHKCNIGFKDKIVVYRDEFLIHQWIRGTVCF